jgi:hypothetical protein
VGGCIRSSIKFQSAAEARQAAEVHPVTYVDFLTVVLTALAVMLAALAIFIGVIAIWGYAGIKEALTKEVRENAAKALKDKLNEYPAAAEMMALKRRVDSVEQIHAQMMDRPNVLAQAPEGVQNEGQYSNISCTMLSASDWLLKCQPRFPTRLGKLSLVISEVHR